MGFQATPVVWNFMTYFLSSSSAVMKALTHSPCDLSLQQWRTSSQQGPIPPTERDAPVLEFLDDAVAVEGSRVLHLGHVRRRLWLLCASATKGRGVRPEQL